MKRLLPMLILCACAAETSKPETAKDSSDEAVTCIATFGDNCGCDDYCLTPDEMREMLYQDECELECGTPNWTCELVDGQCQIVR